MKAHVLLNLLKGEGKEIKWEAFQAFLSLFRNGFNKFNNTGARMFESFNHMTLRLL